MTESTDPRLLEVARIVDRGAWRDMEGCWEDDGRWLSEDHRKGCLAERQGYALTKAAQIEALYAPEIEGLRGALEQIGRMRTMPDDKANTFTLEMAHKLAALSLSGGAK